MFDVWVALCAGVFGYIMRKRNWPMGPLVLSFILGPMIEQALRQTLASGGPSVFLHRPIAMVFLAAAVLTLMIAFKLKRRLPTQVLEDDNK
jgi:putative tricarboxylic transport membrane protein